MKKYLCIVCLLLAGCSSRYNPNIIQLDLTRFRQIENSIGCIGTYNYNRLSSSYRITPIPKTRFEYQRYKKINSKLGKYYE